MQDFTLEAYEYYLKAIKSNYENIFRVKDYFLLDRSVSSFVLLRHDVDRKPKNAIKMAYLENQMGVRSTYYFRARPHVFKPKIILEIAALGHEIGYHYESLADKNGDQKAALKDFEENLARFRELTPVETIAMHGSPLKQYDNRDMWCTPESESYLRGYLDILGEVYLHIDCSDIAYINDTGRNWSYNKHNRRDVVRSLLSPSFKDYYELLACLEKKFYKKIFFQVHPERWADNDVEYYIQWVKDFTINTIKRVVK